MKTKSLLVALVLISAGAIAQEPEQTRTREQVATHTQNREVVQAQERIQDGTPAEDAMQKREQKRLERAERKNARKESALQNRNRGTERSEVARTRSQSNRQEKTRLENRPGVRPEGAGESTGNAERVKTSNRTKGGK